MKIDFEINSLSKYCENRNIPIKYFYKNSSVKKFTNIPKTLDLEVHWSHKKYISKIREYSMDDQYVCELEDCKILGYNRLGSIKLLTKNNELIKSESTNYEQDELSFRKKNQAKGLSVLLCSDSATVFFHWMFQLLPRIDLLNKYNLNWDNVDNIILPNNIGQEFHTETLNHLNVPIDKILRLKRDEVIECEKLIVPSIPVKNIFFSNWIYDFLKKNFLKKEKKHYEKIYISRERAKSRKVDNEEEVFNFLKNKGFTKVSMEDCDVFDQADMFYNAKEIVCPHGSCLANLAYCKPKTKILEFFSTNYVTLLYWSMSNDLDLDYSYLIAEGERSPDGEDPHLGKENMTIDIKQLKKLI
jgi:hypothetical protein